MYNLGILTSSDMGAEGRREDTSGQAIREVLLDMGFTLARYEIVPDERSIIAEGSRSGRTAARWTCWSPRAAPAWGPAT